MPDVWSELSDMPNTNALIGASVGVGNGKLWYPGGSPRLTNNWSYDIATDTWDDTLAILPVNRYNHGTAFLNNKVYVVGGRETGDFIALDTLYEYDTIGDSWVTKATLPNRRLGPSVAVANGKLFAIGGVQTNASGGGLIAATSTTYCWTSNTWSNLAALPSARGSGAGSATVGGKIYVTGGRNSLSAATDTLYIYDISTDSWSTGAPLPVAHVDHGSAGVPGYVFIGGRTVVGTSTPMDEFYRYTIATDTWDQLSDMPAPTFVPAYGSHDGKVYCAGGGTGASGAANLWVWDGVDLPPDDPGWQGRYITLM